MFASLARYEVKLKCNPTSLVKVLYLNQLYNRKIKDEIKVTSLTQAYFTTLSIGWIVNTLCKSYKFCIDPNHVITLMKISL